jgi:hypothetical protein
MSYLRCVIKKLGAIVKILILCLAFTSCERELDLTLNSGDPKVVVEASIENGDFPRVVLTNSTGFFDKIDLSSLKFVTGATIKVTDLNTGYVIPLIEYNLKFPTGQGTDSVTYTAYAPNFLAQPYDSIIGQLEHCYKLDIVSNGKTYSAVTKIPNCKTPVFDSIWLQPENPSDPTDSAMEIRLIYDEPDTLGNYNRYSTQVLRQYKKDHLDEEFLTTFGSVINDKFTNGQRLPFTLDLGYSRRFSFADSVQRRYLFEQQEIYPGDTVNIRWMPIDYNTYTFWETLEYSRNSTGNPFAAPTKLYGNISGGAVGYWGGYGTRIITIIAPK